MDEMIKEQFEANRKRHDEMADWIEDATANSDKIAEGVYLTADKKMIIVGDKL